MGISIPEYLWKSVLFSVLKLTKIYIISCFFDHFLTFLSIFQCIGNFLTFFGFFQNFKFTSRTHIIFDDFVWNYRSTCLLSKLKTCILLILQFWKHWFRCRFCTKWSKSSNFFKNVQKMIKKVILALGTNKNNAKTSL